MRRTRMRKLALLLSLLALGALGLVVFEGGDDETTAKSETVTSGEGYVDLRSYYSQGSKTRAADYKSCGSFGRYRFAVVEGDISCRGARGVMEGFVSTPASVEGGGAAADRLPGGWMCDGDASVDCFNHGGRAPLDVVQICTPRCIADHRTRARELKRDANTWASLFAVRACNRYMGQPVCERLHCETQMGEFIENCTPVSEAFRKSFADATVEDIKFKGVEVVGPSNRPFYLATVKFSNGEVVVFGGWAPGPPPAGSCAGAGPGVRCALNLADLDQNRRFLRAATTPP
jgi:hypothetical protein